MSGASVSRNVIVELKHAVNVCRTNEELTRQRVDQLEIWFRQSSKLPFYRRLRWLLLGR